MRESSEASSPTFSGGRHLEGRSPTRSVFAPGLISVAFYRRRPTVFQVALGTAFTVGASGVLGYLQDAGTPRAWENVALAIVGGLILYVAILAYLLYVYLPKRARLLARAETSPSAPGP